MVGLLKHNCHTVVRTVVCRGKKEYMGPEFSITTIRCRKRSGTFVSQRANVLFEKR